MRRRSLMVVTILIGFVMTAFVAGSALGEHPWESDWDGGFGNDSGGTTTVGDTTLINRDTAFVDEDASSGGGISITGFVNFVVGTVASIL